MFLVDGIRIINVASVQRFGFVADDNISRSFQEVSYITSEAEFDSGAVVAEFKIHRECDVLYRGSGEACFEFYVNLVKALKESKRVVSISDLHPAKSD